MRKSVLGVLVWLAACVPIHTKEIATNTALESIFRHETIENPVTYAAQPSLQGDSLLLTIAAAERCVDIETPRNHRTTHIERHTDLRYMTGLWVIGTLFSFVGVTSYLDPEAAAERQTRAGTMTTPEEARQGGIVLMATGGLAIGAAVINHLRATDSRRDDGVVSGPPIRKEYSCHQRPARDTRVVLELANGMSRSGTTNQDGVVAFPMSDVPGLSLPLRRQTFTLAIGGTRIGLQLADNEVEALWSSLAANPQSRLARDRQAAPHQANDLRQAVCRAHDRSYELLYGAFTCLAPYVQAKDLCADRTAAGIKAVAHRALNHVWARAVPPPQTVEEAFGTVLAKLLVQQSLDQILDLLVVPAASQYMQDACNRLIQDLQLPSVPSENIVLCAGEVLQPRWIQKQCESVAP